MKNFLFLSLIILCCIGFEVQAQRKIVTDLSDKIELVIYSKKSVIFPFEKAEFTPTVVQEKEYKILRITVGSTNPYVLQLKLNVLQIEDNIQMSEKIFYPKEVLAGKMDGTGELFLPDAFYIRFEDGSILKSQNGGYIRISNFEDENAQALQFLKAQP